MSGFFSGSSSKRRYPDPNMGGRHYKRKGLFGMIPGMGSHSGSDSYIGYGGYQNPQYPNQGQINRPGYEQHCAGGQETFQMNGSSAGQAVCPKCGTAVPAGAKFCLNCGEKMSYQSSFCPNCGKPLPAGAKFCSECGCKIQG